MWPRVRCRGRRVGRAGVAVVWLIEPCLQTKILRTSGVVLARVAPFCSGNVLVCCDQANTIGRPVRGFTRPPAACGLVRTVWGLVVAVLCGVVQLTDDGALARGIFLAKCCWACETQSRGRADAFKSSIRNGNGGQNLDDACRDGRSVVV